MKREKWQEKFWEAIEQQGRLPFAYGTRDCILFAARVADSISDGEYEKRARSAFAWTNEREAVKLIAGGLRPLIETVLGPAIPWTRLSMGDLVLIRDDKGRECMTVHDGAKLVGPGDGDLIFAPWRCALCGWKVE